MKSEYMGVFREGRHPPSKPEVCCPDLWFLGEGAHQTSVVRECSLPWMVAPLSELVTGF